MDYQEFESKFAEWLSTVPPEKRRVWKSRGKVPSHIVEKAACAEPITFLVEGDFETGYQPITEEYVRSLGYSDFEKGKRAILVSRQLGESRGKIPHRRWE